MTERAHPAVWGLTGAGFCGVLAGVSLPWVTATLPTPNSDALGAPGIDTLYLTQVGPWQASAYTLGWSVLLALLVMGIVVGVTWRRAVAGAALGWAAGQLAVLVGLLGEAMHGGGVLGTAISRQVPTSTGIGLYASVVGVVLLGGAAAMLLRRPPIDEPAFDADADTDTGSGTGPLDLTVTAVGPGSTSGSVFGPGSTSTSGSGSGSGFGPGSGSGLGDRRWAPDDRLSR